MGATISGTGGLGADCFGVQINGTVTAAGTGSVSVTGTGGGSPGFGVGSLGVIVQIDGGTGVGTSGSGDVLLTGTTPLGFYGTGVFIGSPLDVVAVNSPGVFGVSATGSGSIVVTGTGGGGDRHAAVVVSVDGVVAAGGSVSVTGVSRGGTHGANNHGVNLRLGTVASTDGKVSVAGTALGGDSSSDGVHAEMSSQVRSFFGSVTVAGTGGTGTGSQGVDVTGGTFRSLRNDVTVSGTGRRGTAGNASVRLDGTVVAAGVLSASGSAEFKTVAVALESARLTGVLGVVVSADSLDIRAATGGPLPSVRGGAAGDGTVTIRPLTSGTGVDLGGADVLTTARPGRAARGTLGLSAAELAAVAAGVLVIGDTDTTARIRVTRAVDFNTIPEVHLLASGPVQQERRGALTVARLGVVTRSGAVTLKAKGNQIGTVAASVGGPRNGLTLNGGESVVLGVVGGLLGVEARGRVKVTARRIDLEAYPPSEVMRVRGATSTRFVAEGVDLGSNR